MFIKAMRLLHEMHYMSAIYYEKLVFSVGELLDFHLRSPKDDAAAGNGICLP